jgi:hypothetical protein
VVIVTRALTMAMWSERLDHEQVGDVISEN